MNIYLQKYGEAVRYEIAQGRLSIDSRALLSQQLERDVFDRAVEDITLKFSDMDKFFRNLFISEPLGTRWIITVQEPSRKTFKGEIISDSNWFDPNKEYVEFQAFSVLKSFWDACKTIKNLPQTEKITGVLFQAFSDYFTTYLLPLPAFNGIISAIDFTLYADGEKNEALIRTNEVLPNYIYSVDNWYVLPINNVLMGQCSNNLFDLLKAIGKYHNAEFWIDPDNDTLMMTKRNSPLCTIEKDMSDKLLGGDQNRIQLYLQDAKKYDFVHIFIPPNKPSSPEYLQDYSVPSGARDGLNCNGFSYQYVLTTFDQRGQESLASEILDVRMDDYTNWMHYVDYIIPVCPGDVVKRRLYRKNVTTGTAFWAVEEFDGNTMASFTDHGHFKYADVPGVPLATDINSRRIELPWSKWSPQGSWIRYDEEKGVWEPPILDDGEATFTPDGRVFETKPSLTFRDLWNATDLSATEHEATSEEIFLFFGQNMTFSKQQDLWQEIMMTKRKVICSMMDTDYRVGDAFPMRRLCSDYPNMRLAGNLLVKNAISNLLPETTDVELITL